MLSWLPQPYRARLSGLDPRVVWGGAVAAVVLVAAIALAVGQGLTRTPDQARPAEATAIPTAIPSATPFRPRATPPGTPAPRPRTFVTIGASIPVSPPPAPRATASPEPGLWRVEGYVVDEAGKPIENVCVVIGPVSCQLFSPKTDERGHWFVDVAAAATALVQLEFDFYFEQPGRETVWLRANPQGATVFNLVLRKT